MNPRKPKSFYDKERGFTLVEISIAIVILGIVLTLGTLSYANISNGLRVDGAKKQIEAALQRAENRARQENTSCTIIIYPHDSSPHPNTYEFLCPILTNTGEWETTPFNGAVSGEKVTQDNGHWYIHIYPGAEIVTGGTITFEQKGTETLPIFTPQNDEGFVIELRAGGATKRIVVNNQGNIQ